MNSSFKIFLKKYWTGFLSLAILLGGLLVTTYIVQQQQEIRSRAQLSSVEPPALYPAPIIDPTLCTLSGAVWNTTSNPIPHGSQATLTVTATGNNCMGKTVAFEVFEDDGYGGSDTDTVTSNPSQSSLTFNSSNNTYMASSVWTAEWREDKTQGQTAESQYYFIAYFTDDSGAQTSDDPDLRVTRATTNQTPSSGGGSSSGGGGGSSSGGGGSSSGGGGESQHGLSATYYDNTNFTGNTVTRIDPLINFNWGFGSPADGINSDTFSVRWTGTIYAPHTGVYTFYAKTDDGVRLFINNKLIINRWRNGVSERLGTIRLEGGQNYPIRMEYFENRWRAQATLSLSVTGTQIETLKDKKGNILKDRKGNPRVRTRTIRLIPKQIIPTNFMSP